MALLDLPRELRDKVYRELLITDEPLDIEYLLTVDRTSSAAHQYRQNTLDLTLLNTSQQIRHETLEFLSRTKTFEIYDSSHQRLENLFGQATFQTLREPVSAHRLRLAQQTESYTWRIRHLHIDIDSSTPDSDSAHRLLLRGLLVLAHEADGKGFAPMRSDEWRSSLAAYLTAAILPPASQLRSITVEVSGFLHSESRDLLLEAMSRLYVLGNISLRFRLAGKREDEVLFGRQAIDRSILEQSLSKACGNRVIVPQHGFLLPHSQTFAKRTGLI